MIEFILKGLLRDRHRSLLPIIVISLGVLLTTFMHGWLLGVINDMLSTSAKLETGHVKVMTADYAEIASQMPNDFAILGVEDLQSRLQDEFDVNWAPRIRFGGLLDIPDDNGETRAQGPVAGLGFDMFSPESQELARFDLANVLSQGRLPQHPGELLIADKLMQDLDVQIGDSATLIGSTANGGMAIYNFIVVGSFSYGIPSLDRNMIFADIGDIQYALDMDDATAELLGFLNVGYFDMDRAQEIQQDFNQKNLTDAYGNPLVMQLLTEQGGMAEYFVLVDAYVFILMAIMILFMGVVLWNFGLMSGLRRYGEIGVRLAMGESKTEIVRWLIYEALAIGIVASAIGTALGLSICYYLQEVGLDFTNLLQGSSLLMSPVMRAEVSLAGVFVGFIPGVLSVVLGTALSSLGVYKRSTASLFKELEV